MIRQTTIPAWLSEPENPAHDERHIPSLQLRHGFPSHVTGGCYHANIIQKQILKPKGKEIGVPGLGWHTFRHAYRGFLDETGAPIGVQQKLMRHANVSTTMNVYRNSSLSAKQEANSEVVQMVMKRKAA